MEDIRIYNFEFELLHIESKIISSNWTLYYNKIGNFEAHFALESDIVPVMMKNPYLVVVQGDKQAIVTGKNLTSDFAVFGRTMNWILSRRVIPKFQTNDLLASGEIADQSTLSVMKWIVKTALGEGEDNFYFIQPQGSFGEVGQFWRNVSNPASDVVEDCLALNGFGHKVVYQIDRQHKKQGRWEFVMHQGKRIPLVISENRRNAYETTYLEDVSEAVTGGYYEQEPTSKGDFNAATGRTQSGKVLSNTTPDPADFGTAYEVSVAGTVAALGGMQLSVGDYVVCKNRNGTWSKEKELEVFSVYIESEQRGLYRWEGVLAASTMSEAQSELKKRIAKKKMQSKTFGPKYGTDYELGDVVKVQKQAGSYKETFEKRVIGVNL